MARVFSFRDLKLIPELSKYNEVELLHPVLDTRVNKYLAQLGFNMNAPIEYIPAKHRDIQGKVAVGFRAVGEITQDREFINSHLCSVTERMMAAHQQDPGLAKEMASLMGSSCSFVSQFHPEEEDMHFPAELVERDCDDVGNQIRELEAIRDAIRGVRREEDGSLCRPVMA